MRVLALRDAHCMTTHSPSKIKGVHPNHGDGKFTRQGRTSRCSSQNFSKRCRKLLVPARWLWQNVGPTEPPDNCFWRETEVLRGPRFGRDRVKSGHASGPRPKTDFDLLRKWRVQRGSLWIAQYGIHSVGSFHGQAHCLPERCRQSRRPTETTEFINGSLVPSVGIPSEKAHTSWRARRPVRMNRKLAREQNEQPAGLSCRKVTIRKQRPARTNPRQPARQISKRASR